MSEPQKLQHRVAAAFREPVVPPAEEALDDLHLRFGLPDTRMPHPLEPDLDALAVEEESDRHGMLGYWMAGGALVASALVLSMGTSSGFILLALCLGALGLAPILYSFATRSENVHETKSQTDPAKDPSTRRPLEYAANSYAAAGAMMGTIHDVLGDITLCRGLGGMILSANNTFRKVTGCDAPEGRTCEDLGIRFRPGSIEHCYDVEFCSADGARIYLWHDIVTRDPMLGDLVIQSIARDVTADRLNARSHEQARARAEEDSVLKSRLIATVSHEIRTPLSGLLGMGQLLAGTRLSPEQKNYLDGISQSGTALVQLVEDLLDYSTLAAGRFQLRTTKEAIRPLIESAVELLSSRAHAKGIEIGSTISPDLPENLILDPARLRQVFYNVIGNAVKFTEAGGILVTASLEGSALVVRVRDSGPGMTEAEIQRVFGEFEQGELSRAREGGVGLGLAISARIMAETGGRLSVESKVDQGSTFIIRLPASVESSGMRLGDELRDAKVMLFAPVGPAATALETTLRSLGAETHAASAITDAESVLDLHDGFSGIIVDHRLDAEYTSALGRNPRLAGAKRIYLVNPESRPAQMSGDDYDSWLIRPLREQSLIDVLTGRLKGLEHRAAASEEFPVISAEAIQEGALSTGVEGETGLSILIGEDDPVNAMISQAILEKAGHRVRLASNFTRLAEAMAGDAPDIVLTDYSMPDGTSDEFISRLRDMERSLGGRPLPVIVLTADGSDETRRKLLINGADLVLIKPASPEMINNAIAQLSERLIDAA
ncbi:MAG: sensor histidine kinase/response regulator hybrid protein [Rhizobium sp.]|nr:sensor histidine kinase/response regulator hybrid protein [Rhizobium sp.]